MVNLKKYNDVLKLFVIFLTFIFFTSCSKPNYYITKTEGKRIPITEKENQVPDPSPDGEQAKQIENFIKPYREHINKDLDSVLTYCPVTLDKSSGKWQTTIGNLLADVTLMRSNLVFNARKKRISISVY